MKKILSFLMLMFAAVTLVFAQDPETLASGTFDGKNGTYTEGWSTTGTGVGRNDCVVIGADENITSPEVDLSSYESITVSIKARRYGSLTGKVATIAVTFDGEDIGTVDASTTTATTALDAIDYTVDGLTTGNFVFTCSNATSAGSSHGAGINSIVITGVKSQGGTGTSTKETVYLVNASNWTKPTIHMWGGTANGTSWPGMEMTKTSTQLKGADVYSYTADKGAYANCIFSDNGANQTGDLDWTAGKYYYMNKWYSYDELAGGGEIQVDYYLKNNWDQAAAWTWKKTTPVGDGTYKLENVVFGGTGVNWYTEPVENIDMSNYWIPATDFKGDEVAAGNTVTFVFDPKAKTITATLVGGTTPVDPPITIAYDTVYLVNTLGWATPYCYHWGDYTVQPQWPGEAMTKTEDKVGSYDVYMYVAKEGALSKCIFNNGDAENTIQTEDLKPIQDVGKNDKYYVPGNQQDEVGAYIGGTWYATLDAISGNQLAAGFYLIGLKGWTVADLNEDLKFVETTTDNVYSLTVTLVKDQEFKAVYVNDQGAIANWMPKDGGNFEVTDKYAGEKTVLLNVTGKGGEGWFGGYIYVEPNPEQPEQPTDPTYYLKNNWNGGEWTWKEMTKIEEDDDLYYVLSNVVFGGTGVDLNTEMNDEESATKKWYAVADIPAYDAKSVELDPVVLGALDTVTFIYTPGADAILAAYLLGKYQEGGDPIVPPTPEVIYSVAGSKALLGAEWNEAEGNEMALDKEDGLYKLLCADVTLAVGSEYKFKIVTNHDWSNPNYPDQDKVLTVDKDGKYDVTITFNADTKDVAYVAEFKGSAVVEKHYLIVGEKAVANGEYWNNAADINLLKSADEGLTYTLVVENAELKAETPYGYKVVEQGSWTEYFPNIGGDNAYISVEADGVYTITYTYTVATSQCVAVTTKTGDIPGPVDPPTPGTVYYMKNNWEAGADWTWKAMTQDGEIYKLENVVFGGYGVNYNTAESDEGAAWVAVDDILGDEIAAKDTVTFVLNPVKATVTATLIGKYQDGGDTPEPPTPGAVYYMKNNWDGGEWTWKEMTQDGDIYKLENVVFGGYGVNYSTSMEDLDPAWVALEDILGDEIAALDTVTFVLNPVKATVTATLIGKYVDPVTPPTPEEYVTLYFVNVDKWENVYAYVWNDAPEIGALAAWPGTKMTITEDSVGDYAVYSFTFATKYNKVIFDNGSGGAGNQTSDMIWNAATPYYYDGIWYASLDDINPAAETKFYISGNANLVGAGSVWDPKAIKSLEDSYTLHLTPGVYLLKISLDGTDATWKGFSDLSEITPGLTQWDSENVIAFTLAQEGDVVVTYKVVNEVVTFTVVGKFFTIESGFYLMSMNKTLFDFTEADKFAPNTGTEGEYMLNTTLTEGDNIAVVMVANNAIYRYYIGENFYYVDANHAGATTIYFRPEGNAEWTETGGYFYVVPTSTTGIEETIAAGKAAKVLRNGQILILKGDKMYNVMGAVIR